MKYIFPIFLLLISALGCDSRSEDPQTQLKSYSLIGLEGEKIILVADRTQECTGEGVHQCLLVKESQNAPWELWYDGIAGFTYKEGTNYVLRIIEKQIPDPPQDASSIEWIYIETLETWIN